MFNHCQTWLRIQLEATVSNTLHWHDLTSLLLKKANLPASNLKLFPILVDLVLQIIVKREKFLVILTIVMLNFCHFLNHKGVVFLFVLFP